MSDWMSEARFVTFKSAMPDAKVVRIHALRAQGWSYRRIGDAVGCSMWTVRDIVNRVTRPE